MENNMKELDRAMAIGNPIRELDPLADDAPTLLKERAHLIEGGWKRIQQGSDYYWVKPAGQ